MAVVDFIEPPAEEARARDSKKTHLDWSTVVFVLSGRGTADTSANHLRCRGSAQQSAASRMEQAVVTSMRPPSQPPAVLAALPGVKLLY